MLSTWPKDVIGCRQAIRPSISVHAAGFFPDPDRLLDLPSFPMSFSFQNFGTWPIYDTIFFRYMICYDRLVHFCCPALSVWPCECSVANRFYFFSVFLLSLPIISASLSNICTVAAVVAWNPVYTHSPVCSTVRWSFGWNFQILLKNIILVETRFV